LLAVDNAKNSPAAVEIGDPGLLPMGQAQNFKLESAAVRLKTHDNEHFVNASKAHAPPQGGQPARMSLWEIHPIIDFFVCEAGACDPTDHSTWITLTAWAKKHPK